MPDNVTPNPAGFSGEGAASDEAVVPAAPNTSIDSDSPARNSAEAGESNAARMSIPEFAALKSRPDRRGATSMDRFLDVNVPVWVELGRVEMPLGELMKLDEGSVLRLDRPVSEPVDLVSQGVKLARGEVVVIDDCFAIRIKEIESAD